MKVAIIEDDINMRKSLELFFSDIKDLEIVSFKSPKDALKALDSSFELVITDINMPQMDGLTFLKELDGKFEAIIITGNATLSKAIDSLRLGVRDFFQKPFSPDLLLEAIYRAKKERSKREEFAKTASKTNVPKNATKGAKHNFIAQSKALEHCQDLALKVAKTDASVLLLGESGVGKEVFANFIHNNSPRKDAPFIALNMAAIPEHLLESELFGFEKGAFTDASAQKIGLLELANKGSLFLDEIGEMPLLLQAKLLRVLQEREFMRLGGNKMIKIDVRFISATNANMSEKIKNKEFREDLFFRLQTVPLFIPPLRERKDEILDLANWRLEVCAKEYGFNKTLSKDAKDALLKYAWHGNVRELISVIERAVILSNTDVITSKDLFLEPRF
ncbi:MAG: sigma-54 dependent transcriptional regulator [Helicobacter sp.]|nr:sigma-54 dependent transcriptional regulator [Helicobacter sp.]